MYGKSHSSDSAREINASFGKFIVFSGAIRFFSGWRTSEVIQYVYGDVEREFTILGSTDGGIDTIAGAGVILLNVLEFTDGIGDKIIGHGV
jgi:hypothetical protein